MGNERRGIACAGNWIIDHVYICDAWPPREETLVNILEESRGTGGSPYNVLKDLAAFGPPEGGQALPLEAVGLTGEDADGRFIHDDLAATRIDASALARTADAPTSHTLVIVNKPTGRRTFFHNRGANALFGPEHVPVDRLAARIFHLGYLLLLDRFDEADPQYGTVAARVLKAVQDAGIETSLDVVSEVSDRFPRIVQPALKYADYCILNEFEAGQTVGLDLRPDDVPDADAVREAAERLLGFGVRQLVGIHMPEGGYVRTADGRERWHPSLQLPEGYIRGGAGAGDAFCAGVLFGLHERWDLERALRLGVCAAAVCLADPTCTNAASTVEATLALADRYGFREPLF